jgi:membrane protein required for colicin V production
VNFIDIVLGLLLLYGLYKGVRNGLLVEIASILALIAGLYGAIHFSYLVGDYMELHFNWNEKTMSLVSFLLTFFIIVILVILAAKFLTKVAELAMLGLLNRIAGGLFGLLKVGIILGALLIFLESVNKSLRMFDDDIQEHSVLYEPIRNLGDLVFSAVIKKDREEVDSPE